MQTDEPAPPPLAYYNPTLEPRRPASIKVIAILGIVFDSYLSLSLWKFLIRLVSSPLFPTSIPKIYIVWLLIDAFMIGFLMLACINSIRLRPVGRRQMIYWAWLFIATLSFSMSTLLLWIVPGIIKTGSLAGSPAIRVGILVEFMVSLVFPVLVLIFYRNPVVIAAFENAAHKSASA